MESIRRIQCVYSQVETMSRTGNNQPEERLRLIRDKLQSVGVFCYENESLPYLEQLTTVHGADYLNFLEHAYKSVVTAGDQDWIRDGGLVPNHRHYSRHPVSENIPLYKMAGVYGTDTMSPVYASTYRCAAISAQNSILCARMLIKDRAVIPYALNASPGHHASHSNYGGYCFINNAAVAAKHIQASEQCRVAILDLDYHHGNGQQDIFYGDDNVVTVSLHCDPVFDYPSFAGYVDEVGVEKGRGFNRNFPLAPGTARDAYLYALESALSYIVDCKCEYLVVAFGGDTYAHDPDKSPIAGFALELEDYELVGQAVARKRLPVMVTQEGGYDMSAIADIATRFLRGLSENS